MHHSKSNKRSKILATAISFVFVFIVALNLNIATLVSAAGECPEGWYLASQPGGVEVCLRGSGPSSAAAQSQTGNQTQYQTTGGGSYQTTAGGKTDRGGGMSLDNPLGDVDTIEEFILTVIRILMIFAVPIIVFMIIYAGFLYVLARGNEEQVTRATRALTYAIVGGLLILGAEFILRVIQGTVNQLTP